MEWAEDSKPEQITATCDRIVAKIPEAERETSGTKFAECTGAPDCEGYIACMKPILRAKL